MQKLNRIGYASTIDDYLSDIPSKGSLRSRSNSEASGDNDYKHSIEKKFKEKYELLRSTFEERVAMLSETVENVCSTIVYDEFVMGLKADPTSIGFIPAHIAEVFSVFLKNDREKYLMDHIEREKTLEFKLREYAEEISVQKSKLLSLEHDNDRLKNIEQSVIPLKDQLNKIQDEYKLMQIQGQNEAKDLLQEKDYLQSENKKLSDKVEFLSQEVRNEKDKYQLLQKESQQIINDKHQTERSFYNEQSSIGNELHDTIFQLNYFKEENQKLQVKIKDIITNVETILEQDASENDLIITSLQKKIRNIQESSFLDVQREKNLAISAKEEASIACFNLNERTRENKHLLVENQSLNEQMTSLKKKIDLLEHQLKDITELHLKEKQDNFELHTTITHMKQTSIDMEQRNKVEFKLFEEKIKLDFERAKYDEQRQSMQTSELMKLRLENSRVSRGYEALDVSRASLDSRGGILPSYSGARQMIPNAIYNSSDVGGYSSAPPRLVSHARYANVHMAQPQALLPPPWNQGRTDVSDSYRGEGTQNTQGMRQSQTRTDMYPPQQLANRLRSGDEHDNNGNYDNMMHLSKQIDEENTMLKRNLQLMKDKIDEADEHISKLKRMVQEGKSAHAEQVETIQNLKNKINILVSRQNHLAASISESFEAQHRNMSVENVPEISWDDHLRKMAQQQSVSDVVIADLKKEIVLLQEAAADSKNQGIQEQAEEDSVLIENMKSRFDLLVQKHDINLSRMSEELNEKTEHITFLQRTVEDLERQLKEAHDSLTSKHLIDTSHKNRIRRTISSRSDVRSLGGDLSSVGQASEGHNHGHNHGGGHGHNHGHNHGGGHGHNHGHNHGGGHGCGGVGSDSEDSMEERSMRNASVVANEDLAKNSSSSLPVSTVDCSIRSVKGDVVPFDTFAPPQLQFEANVDNTVELQRVIQQLEISLHEKESMLMSLESALHEQADVSLSKDRVIMDLRDEVFAKDKDLFECKHSISSLHDEIISRSEEITSFKGQICELKETCDQANGKVSQLQNSLSVLTSQHSETLLETTSKYMQTIENLKQMLKKEHDISSNCEEKVRSEYIKQICDLKSKKQRLLDRYCKLDEKFKHQMRILRSSLATIKNQQLLLQDTVISDISIVGNKFNIFVQPILDKMKVSYETQVVAMQVKLASIHTKQEYNFLNQLRSSSSEELTREDEKARKIIGSEKDEMLTSTLRQVEEHKQMIRLLSLVANSMIEAIYSCGIVSESVQRELRYMLNSITPETVGNIDRTSYEDINVSMYNILYPELRKYAEVYVENLTKKDIALEELAKERVKREECETVLFNFQRNSNSEYLTSMNNKLNDIEMARVGQDTALLHEVARIEAESKVKSLLCRMQDMEHQHRIEVNKIRLEQQNYTQHTASNGAVGDMEGLQAIIDDLNNKLQLEKSRRQQLQLRLVAEESAHRREIEELEKRGFDLQQRAEKAELTWSKLKMEHLHTSR